MRRIRPLALIVGVTLGVIAWGYRHDILEWWRFDRFGTHQPLPESWYSEGAPDSLGDSIP